MPDRSYQTLPRQRGGIVIASVGVAGLAVAALVWVAGPQLGTPFPKHNDAPKGQIWSPGGAPRGVPGGAPEGSPGAEVAARSGAAPAVAAILPVEAAREALPDAPLPTPPLPAVPLFVAGDAPTASGPAQLALLRRLLQIDRLIDTTTVMLSLPELQPGAHLDAVNAARRQALLADRAAALADHERLRQQLLALLPELPGNPQAGTPRSDRAPAPPPAEPGAPASLPPSAGPDAVRLAPGPFPAPAPQRRAASNGAPRTRPGDAPAGAAAPVARAPLRAPTHAVANATANSTAGAPSNVPVRAPGIANSPQCHAILLRAQLGEELSIEDHGALRRGCRASP